MKPSSPENSGRLAGISNSAPPTIPDHTLIKRIGSGSYGTVWLAKSSLGEFRAVKIIRKEFFPDARPFDRELAGIRKFEPISRLDEGFIDILHAGLNAEEGYFYYIMELGDDCERGRDIDPQRYTAKTLRNHIIERKRLSVTECLDLGMRLAKAINQLHEFGFIHRDVKPSNILYVAGQPKLSDVGLVIEIDGPHSFVGTEGFVPPEGPGTPAADIYGLGKVLYEAGTGCDRNLFPRIPVELADSPESEHFAELNEVILRACDPDPKKRFKNAAEMLGEILSIADGRSVKRIRQLERKLSLVKNLAWAFIILCVVVVAIGYPFYRAHRSITALRDLEYGGEIAEGNHALESGNLVGSLPYFAEALRLDHEANRDELIDRDRLGLIFSKCPQLTGMWSEHAELLCGEYSPDGREIAVCSEKGAVRVLGYANGAQSDWFGETNAINALAFSRSGKYLATASDSSIARIYDADSLRLVVSFPHPDHVKSLQFLPDDQRIVTGCRDGYVRIIDIRSQDTRKYFCGKTLRVANVSHSGAIMATGDDDGKCLIWNLESGDHLERDVAQATWIMDVAFRPDDSEIATASADGTVQIASTNGHTRFPLLQHADAVSSVNYSPDGRWILTACLDGTVRLWNAETLRPLEIDPILPNGERAMHAAFSPDGRCIVAVGALGTVRVWHMAASSTPPRISSCKLSRDGNLMALLEKRTVTLIDVNGGERACRLSVAEKTVTETDLTSNLRFRLSVRNDDKSSARYASVLEIATGKLVGKEIKVADPKARLSLSDDAKTLAIINGVKCTLISVTKAESDIHTITANAPIANSLFDTNGSRLITWGGTNIEVWKLEDGSRAVPVMTMDRPVSTVTISTDATKIAGCCLDERLTPCYSQIFDLKTGKSMSPKLYQGDGVTCACFNGDGSRLATGSEDSTAVIWNTVDGHKVGKLMVHQKRIVSITYSPDSRWLLTSSDDQSSRIWDAATGDPISPPFLSLIAASDARFFKNRTMVVTSDIGGNNREWRTMVDDRPVSEIVDHAQLLAATTDSRFGQFVSENSESAVQTWQRLRNGWPSLITPKAEAIIDWHKFGVEECQSRRNWWGVAFHLGYLVQLEPTNTSYSDKLKVVLAHLKK